MSGCEKQMESTDCYRPEIAHIDVEESRDVHFFECPKTFDLSASTFVKIEDLLRKKRGDGIENLSFMLISNSDIPFDIQKKIKRRLYSIIAKHGFIKSRTIYAGTCTYDNAKTGLRLDILKYNVRLPNAARWAEYIGDTDTHKNLPKYRCSDIYNLEMMIANPADLVAPRQYCGQAVKDALSAIGLTSSGGSSGGAPANRTSAVGTK
jgi:type IV pilus biogenesis protein CpaD/CtpE